MHGVDIDAQSVVVARENAAVNRVGSRIDFVYGPGVSTPRSAGPRRSISSSPIFWPGR